MPQRSNKVVILAGGKGTRLLPYTTVLPKPLMPVGDMPILEILIRQLKHFGLTNLTLSVGHLSSLLEAYCGNGDRWGVDISYSHEDQPLGTAAPIALVEDLTDPFLVMNGDVLSSLDFDELIAHHERSGALATICAYGKEVRINLGVLETDGKGHLVEYREKPVLNYRVSMGVYVFRREITRFLSPSQRLDLPELVQLLIRGRHPVALYEFDGYWRDIGTMEDYEKVNTEFDDIRARLHLD